MGRPRFCNLGPAYDQFVVSELFMAKVDRVRENLDDADNHLKRAEETVGPFALLEMDCLLERAWLSLAQGDTEKAREKCKTVRGRAKKHHYLCIEKELSDLEKILPKD